MIWAIDYKEDIENYPISPIFKYYREVLGKENISLIPYERNVTSLDFIRKGDLVLLRIADKNVIDFIKKNMVESTAESFECYEMVKDKATLNSFFKRVGIPTPNQYTLSDLKDGETYFVKPRFGSESIGITQNSICHSVEEVLVQKRFIEKEYGHETVIEKYIEGVDCTVACHTIKGDKEKLKVYPIGINTSSPGNIQTHTGKCLFDEYCYALPQEEVIEISKLACEVFRKLNLEHHARIDFRRDSKGNFYVIDINLIPGLGPTAHFSKCMLLAENKSYKDAIMAVINSAS